MSYFCFIDIDVDGKDELIIFSPYWGTCGFRIYDIQETSRKIQLKPISKKEFDRAERLLIASEEGFLLVWWRNCIYKYKILKNTARSIIKLKEVDKYMVRNNSSFPELHDRRTRTVTFVLTNQSISKTIIQMTLYHAKNLLKHFSKKRG